MSRLRDSRQRTPGAFFAGAKPRILAHRGLALDCDENTLFAIGAALAAGAQIIETDVQATRDGAAVLMHDETLATGAPVSGLTLAELQGVRLPRGGMIPTLQEALTAFPNARFNIDLKSAEAIASVIAVIIQEKAQDRVLVTSFSGSRRRVATRALSGVATSASATMVVAAVLAGAVGWRWAMRRILRNVDAVQIPERVLRVGTTTPPMVKRFHAAGVEIHVWTINEESAMKRLLGAGVDGIVTDRCDVAQRVFAL